MPQSYDRIILHTICGTKYRRPLITPEIEPHLLRYMVAMFKGAGCHVIRINGTADHVHILHSLPRVKTIADLMRDVKKFSSKFVNGKFPTPLGFEWQGGYSTFSMDHRDLRSITRYIENQKVHHGSGNPENTFQKELSDILNAYGVEFDAKYLFPPDPFAIAS